MLALPLHIKIVGSEIAMSTLVLNHIPSDAKLETAK